MTKLQPLVVSAIDTVSYEMVKVPHHHLTRHFQPNTWVMEEFYACRFWTIGRCLEVFSKDHIGDGVYEAWDVENGEALLVKFHSKFGFPSHRGD